MDIFNNYIHVLCIHRIYGSQPCEFGDRMSNETTTKLSLKKISLLFSYLSNFDINDLKFVFCFQFFH